MPKRLSSIHEGRSLFRALIGWYDQEYRHSGISMGTPESVHRGNVDEVLRARQAVLDAAYARHPERYGKGRPQVATMPTSVRINPPACLPEGLMGRQDASGILGAAG